MGKKCITNWSRINAREAANEIILPVNKMSIRYGLRWNQAVINCLNNMGLGGLTRDQFIHIKALNRLTDIFHQRSLTTLVGEGANLGLVEK